ncbi:MAG: hypothetical protein WCP28_20505 [Actinomycetes bacterium]
MVRTSINVGIHLLANAVGLFVAWLLLKGSGMSISGLSFVIAVVIFTLVEVLAELGLGKFADKKAPVLRGGVALIATFVGLLITSLLSQGLSISGFSTWVLATFIVWLAALLAGLLLPVLLVKKAVDPNQPVAKKR